MGVGIAGLENVARHDAAFAERIRAAVLAAFRDLPPASSPTVLVAYDHVAAPGLAHLKLMWPNRVISLGLRSEMTQDELSRLVSAAL